MHSQAGLHQHCLPSSEQMEAMQELCRQAVVAPHRRHPS